MSRRRRPRPGRRAAADDRAAHTVEVRPPQLRRGGRERPLRDRRPQTADRRPIGDELDALGYITVSEYLLRTRYDGVSNLGTSAGPRTWWHRFFDYN
ncbi:hypothetical protein AB0D08_30090 [Kitasatospora sp. NPDC048540]|uniref:hypothetical protein n=1 Tax=Kitasatospora sp. NPDC048540 TaxID=3155634 RepID=UPI0033FB8F5A